MPSARILKRCIAEAQKSKELYRVGSILYCGSSILRSSYNSIKYVGKRLRFFEHGEPTRHAELKAIDGIPKDILSKCSIVVIRIRRSGEITCAKPCIACFRALKEASIKRVYYSTFYGTITSLDIKNIEEENYKKDLAPYRRVSGRIEWQEQSFRMQ